MKNNALSLRGKKYFVCEYTGGPCATRFFVPTGKLLRGKQGCYATLPILLRHQAELLGGENTEAFRKLKQDLESFYNQPDIPLAPVLLPEAVPLSQEELRRYIEELEMGQAWLLVQKGQPISTVHFPSDVRPARPDRKRAREEKDEEDEEDEPVAGTQQPID